jgi:histone H3/H4
VLPKCVTLDNTLLSNTPIVAALREIRYYQKQTALILPKAPFRRVVNEVACDTARQRGLGYDFRWQQSALDALQEATEASLVGFFESKSALFYCRVYIALIVPRHNSCFHSCKARHHLPARFPASPCHHEEYRLKSL